MNENNILGERQWNLINLTPSPQCMDVKCKRCGFMTNNKICFETEL